MSNLTGIVQRSDLADLAATALLPGLLTLSTDLGGISTAPTVVGLRGIGISVTPPVAGQALVYNGTQWFPISVEGAFTSVDKEPFTGNGITTVFTLAHVPFLGSEHIYRNGALQDSGAGNDYTISGAVITFLTTPASGDKIRVSYRY